MKKLTALLSFCLLATTSAFAQDLIAVQGTSGPSFYTDLQAAVTAAQAGDTIYIPAGIYGGSSTIQINKELHLYGNGHYPNSMNTAGRTIVYRLWFYPGSDSSSVTGIYFSSYLYLGTSSSDTISAVEISRCNIYEVRSYSTLNINFIFFENILGDVLPFTDFYYYYLYFKNSLFSNNVFRGSLSISNYGNIFKNNLFYNDVYATNSTFENNIFLDIYGNVSYPSYSSLNNNYYRTSNYAYNNTVSGTISTTLDSIIAPTLTDLQNNGFSYSHDYSLVSGSPGANAGTDSTDIGIYGGFSPWKENGVPANPHIELVDIDNQTNQNGELRVKVQVKAQDR